MSEATKKAARSEPSVFDGLELTMLGGETWMRRHSETKWSRSECGIPVRVHATIQWTPGTLFGNKRRTSSSLPCHAISLVGRSQDPKEIRKMVEERYGVTFPILSKQNVKGPDKGELFDRLTKTAVGGASTVKWNFEKFLISRKGQVVDRFSSITGPTSSALASAIERELPDP